ncbi:MAG TPA: undecaprenyl-diphosphate phosphatase [Lachnospiraceae bacterium]|nr:undecaprenyl-diphosphate phosphatase [Lachnospiraceae bacterium]
MDILEIFKVIILGIVEGITEWLPISSTGHMLLVDEFLKLNMTDAFKDMFFYVIQLGAILAVVVMFWNKMFPFSLKEKSFIKMDIMKLWFKVLFAIIPGVIAYVLIDDFADDKLSTPVVIATMLFVYGILFIIIENANKTRDAKINSIAQITYKTAFIIGLFQALSIIPGTSRSGATILGALLIGVSRTAAAEFTFFLAVPTMFGTSALKILKFGFDFTSNELIILIVGMVVAFVVSIIAIKFLMGYIKKHDFKVFGWYRIVLGLIVLIYFLV